MKSLYDELSEKIRRESSHAARSGPRQDLGILLFSQREAMAELWKAAEGCLPSLGKDAGPELRSAVDRLRPLFGER